MQSIFEPLVRFTEDDSIGHANETSLGIGLYVTREIVHAHKGVIHVDSSNGEGTTFTVRLPRIPAAEMGCRETNVAPPHCSVINVSGQQNGPFETGS